MWRAYGAQDISGTVAIGLDPAVPLGPLFADGETFENWTSHWGDDAAMPHMTQGWTAMNYVSPESLAEQAPTELISGLAKIDLTRGRHDYEIDVWRLVDQVIADIEARYKHHAYAAEGEHRLQAQLTSRQQFKVFPRPQGMSAYLELTASETWGRPVTVASRLPVREVTLWPSAPRQAFSGCRRP